MSEKDELFKRCEAASRKIARSERGRYQLEKIEAYNVAIEALRMHESADPDPDGLDWVLRTHLADKLSNEIDRWYRDFNPTRHTPNN